jgi:hypothetical protein
MRCKRLIAVLLAAGFWLGGAAPAIAGDGSGPKFLDEQLKDHPWQDESGKAGGKSIRKPLRFVIGPMTFTVNVTIPYTQKPSQAPTKPANTNTTQKNVEKRK